VNHEEWINIPDVSRLTGIPERTLRRYTERHSMYLPSRRQGRMHLLAASAVPVAEKIRDLYGSGKDAEEVDRILAESVPATVTIAPQAADQPPPPPGQVEELAGGLRQLARVMAEAQERQVAALTWIRDTLSVVADQAQHLGFIEDESRQLREQVGRLQQVVERQQEALKREAEERDRKLMAAMRELLAERRKPFWRRWFARPAAQPPILPRKPRSLP
jgi:DNA-binding transcriptional MerR regulator